MIELIFFADLAVANNLMSSFLPSPVKKSRSLFQMKNMRIVCTITPENGICFHVILDLVNDKFYRICQNQFKLLTVLTLHQDLFLKHISSGKPFKC